MQIDKCEDNPRTEADLWKDHLFAKKVKRFLCVTRVFPLDGVSTPSVLCDEEDFEVRNVTKCASEDFDEMVAETL